MLYKPIAYTQCSRPQKSPVALDFYHWTSSAPSNRSWSDERRQPPARMFDVPPKCPTLTDTLTGLFGWRHTYRVHHKHKGISHSTTTSYLHRSLPVAHRRAATATVNPRGSHSAGKRGVYEVNGICMQCWMWAWFWAGETIFVSQNRLEYIHCIIHRMCLGCFFFDYFVRLYLMRKRHDLRTFIYNTQISLFDAKHVNSRIYVGST